MGDTTSPTAASNTSPRAQPWTTRSKKEMFLGLREKSLRLEKYGGGPVATSIFMVYSHSVAVTAR